MASPTLHPLLRAANDNDIEGLKRLLERRSINVNLTGPKSNLTALSIASIKGNEAMVARLIDAGASLDVRSNAGQTPMHVAAIFGHVGVIKRLLDAGASKDIRCKAGYTAIRIAASSEHDGSVEVVEMLLDAGASVDIRCERGDTAIQAAYRYRRLDVAELLESRLHFCAFCSMSDQSEELIECTGRTGRIGRTGRTGRTCVVHCCAAGKQAQQEAE